MKVIIEIPDDATFLEVTTIKLSREDDNVFYHTSHDNYKVKDLEKVEEKQEPLGDFEDDWSMKDEQVQE
jgi:hypothetical protein